jgi:hypothetical protein
MSWDYRIVVIVPAASKPAAEQAARAINSTGPDYEGDAFTLPLSGSGTGPATHYGLYTSATDEMVDAMATALPSLSGVQYWRHGAGGDLQASNVTDATGQPWGLAESLNAAGLAQIPEPSPYG